MEANNLCVIVPVEDEVDDVVQGDSLVVSNDEIDSAGSLVGAVADKWEDLYELYKKHSQAIGFSIRKSGLRRADTPGAPERERYFICSCEGRNENGKKAEASADINGHGKKNVKTRCESVTKGRSKRKPSSVGKKKRSKKGSDNVASNAELYTPVPRLL
ncbi:uncharacterized protein LOC141587976 [Silene latifolia]|uniref:uncharacterized protein LOC141587976 n=1 Tax=Silene latifolia TaxID=37657 RepID=UPI003D780A74